MAVVDAFWSGHPPQSEVTPVTQGKEKKKKISHQPPATDDAIHSLLPTCGHFQCYFLRVYFLWSENILDSDSDAEVL